MLAHPLTPNCPPIPSLPTLCSSTCRRISDTTWGEDFCKDLSADCGMTAHFVSDDAFVHKSSMHCRGYRPFFDIAMPLPTDWRWVKESPHAAGVKLRARLLRGGNDIERSLLLFFKGALDNGDGVRSALAKLHDPTRQIIAVGSKDATWPYGEVSAICLFVSFVLMVSPFSFSHSHSHSHFLSFLIPQ